MKLLKKLLAAVTVTALALTMLTACGSDGGKNTFTLVDYLNDWAIAADEGVNFKADTTLDANAKSVADVLKSAGVKTVQDVEKKVETDETFAEKLFTAVGINEQTENKYHYQIGYTQVGQKWTTDFFKDNELYLQAETILSNTETLNVPEAAKKYNDPEYPEGGYYVDKTKLESTVYLGTSTVELGGKTYMVVIFRTAVKA